MSYSRSYSETITVRGSKSQSFSYPASEHGGSQTVTISYTEHVPVNVNIHVDTSPFDSSVARCNTNVNQLTGSVIAAKTAQIIAIEENSKKIAGSIISGFFRYIRSDISQQIAELSQGIDANLAHLTELAKACLNKTKQMETDYNRISSRYLKVFEDLNNELSNRISELDKPTFTFKKEIDHHTNRVSDNDLISTATIAGAENSDLQAKISASVAKKRALDTINQAKMFLTQQKRLERTITQSMINENSDAEKYIPVALMETRSDNATIEKEVYISGSLNALNGQNIKNELAAQFASLSEGWDTMPQAQQDKIQMYFTNELNKKYPAADPRSARIKETIQRMADFNAINTIS